MSNAVEFYDWAEGEIEATDHPFIAVYPTGTDYRDLGPTSECPCGSELMYVLTQFDVETREIGVYFTDAMCAGCNSLLLAPTPCDDTPFTRPMDDLDFFEPSPAIE